MDRLREREIKYSVLLGMLIITLLLPSTAPRREIFNLSMVLLLGSSVAAISKDRRNLLRAAMISLVPIAAVLLPASSRSHAAGHILLQAAFLIYITGMILSDVFSRPEVTRDTLVGSVCAYFMVGMFFTLIYTGIELSYPNSFHSAEGPVNIHYESISQALQEMSYFSMVTMTTVGYGDIQPVFPVARSVAILQAVFGQFYLALMVGRLLAKYLNQNSGQRETLLSQQGGLESSGQEAAGDQPL